MVAVPQHKKVCVKVVSLTPQERVHEHVNLAVFQHLQECVEVVLSNNCNNVSILQCLGCLERSSRW